MAQNEINYIASSATPSTKAKKKKFYFLDASFYSKRPHIEILNEQIILDAIGHIVLGRFPGVPIFDKYPEMPKISFGKKTKHPPNDLEPKGGYWLISDRLKEMFERVDEAAFSFCQCETSFLDGSEAPTYWLCDVIRMLDAVDEKESVIKIHLEENNKYYSNMGYYSYKFKSEVVKDSKIFRLLYQKTNVVCDEEFKNYCKGFTGISFPPAVKPKRKKRSFI